MRIISKFRDYYDTVQDPSDKFIWVREQEFKPLKNDNLLRFLRNILHYHHDGQSGYYSHGVIVGFCGRLIPRIYTNKSYSFGILGDYNYKSNIYKIYTKDNIDSYPYASTFSLKKLRKVFKNDSEIKEFHLDKLFYEYKTPIFTIQKNDNDLVVCINPFLKNIKWFKEYDSWQAYQEIEMFLRNNLAEDTADKIKVDEEHRKGSRFDEWSFKNLPWKKKK